jgi:hypothetical protein
MIELKAAEGENPAIEWDETKTTLKDQTTEAQAWVSENILNTDPVVTTETVHSVVEDVDWTRPKSELYTAEGFTLEVVRTHRDVETAVVASATYTLATV